MSYLLPHLHTGFAVDQAILSVSHGLYHPEGSGLHIRYVHVHLHETFDDHHRSTMRQLGVLQEESRVVIIRFGHDWDQVCMIMDEVSDFLVKLVPFLRQPKSCSLSLLCTQDLTEACFLDLGFQR